MNQKEWRTSTAPARMLEYLKRSRRCRVDGRKVLLFGCRCVRRISKRLAYQESEDAIRVAERFADGLATAREMHQARRAARDAANAARRADGLAAAHAAEAAWCLVRMPNDDRLDRVFLLNRMQGVVHRVWRSYFNEPDRRPQEEQAQADLLREVVGDPWGDAEVKPDWLLANDRAVARIADTIYAERRWDEMPILGDALEDAGCTDAAILGHCRAETTHCRGCWLLDALRDRWREMRNGA